MALDQNIGMVTAYAYAVSKGYTGTEEQFAQELASAGADLSQIQTQIDNFINTIVPAKTAEVTAEGTRQIGLVAAEGTAQKNAVTEEGTTQKNAVISEGTTQKNAVNSAGSTQVNAVNSAGSTQVGNVNTAGSTQVGAVQAKGQEVINSIPSDYTALSDDVDDLKTNVTFNKVINIYDLEDGYYNESTGAKADNTGSQTFKRTRSLIPVDELSLYVCNIAGTKCACFDRSGTFIKTITLAAYSTANKRTVTPTGTAFVGLHYSNATMFSLEKYDASEVQYAEYPYADNNLILLDGYWCNANGNVAASASFKMLIFAGVKEGEKYYVSNNASAQCMFHNESGTLIATTPEAKTPLGKVFTVPSGAVDMYVNLYKNRTTGTSTDLMDYIAKLNGKKVLCIGDSLTWLDGRANYGNAAYFSGWQRQLRLAGYDVTTAAWSGYPYATGLDIEDNVDYSIYKEVVTNQLSVAGYDYVILFGGTNDVLYNGALGSRPTDYSNRTFDASTFNGALGAIISYIRTNNTTAKILLASFPKSEAATRTFANSNARVEEIKYNSLFWSCEYVDIFTDMNVQPTYDGFDLFFYDTSHPNFDGMQIIGGLMLKAIETYQ